MNIFIGYTEKFKDSNGNSSQMKQMLLTAQQFSKEDEFDGDPNAEGTREPNLSLVETYEEYG